MIRKYQNELIVLVAFMVFLGGFLYQKGASSVLENSIEKSRTTFKQVNDTKTLQQVWGTKGLTSKVSQLRNELPSANVKKFEQGKGKLTAEFGDMTGQELNLISTKVASLPLKIQKFDITRAGDRYDMRCQCTW